MHSTPQDSEDIALTNHMTPAAEPLSQRLLRGAAQIVATGSSKESIRGLAQQIVEIVPLVDGALLWSLHPSHGVLRPTSCAMRGIDYIDAMLAQLMLRPGEGLHGAIVQSNVPRLVTGRARYRDLAVQVSQRNQGTMRQLLDIFPREHDITSLLLPIRLNGMSLGVLELLYFGQPPVLSEDDLAALHTFATLIGSNIVRVQLREQLQTNQRRLEVFGAISTAVSTAADLEELMGNVLDVLLQVVDSSVGALLLLNPATAMLTLGAHRNIPPEYVELYHDIPVAGAACEEAVRYGQPISRPLIAEGEETPLISAGLSSCVYLPLLAGGTVTGVVCVYGETALYELVDVQALMLMGGLVGFAIANVTLYQVSDIERRRLQAVINGIAEGVALCDKHGRLVLANQTAMALLSVESMPYQQSISDMNDFYGMRDIDGTPLLVEQMPFARALSGEVFHDYRVLVQGASGNDTVMSFSGAPVYRDDAQTIEGAVAVFRDITASQKIERAKDDFLAVAAHELRSPLAAVRSYTDLLVRRELRKGDEDSSELRGLNTLAQQVSHMLQMVDNLLDVSRLDADQFNLHVQSVDVVALADLVIQQQGPLANDRVIRLETDQTELFVQCDQLRIRQVLTNIISNAVRYSPPQTEVRVSLSVQRADHLAACYSNYSAARATDAPLVAADTLFALLAIEDQGSGVSDEQHGRLFQRYARGRERRGEGLGLGLYLSREFVVRHGGAIWVESQPGQGSTFFVALPLHAPDALLDVTDALT